MAERKYMPIQEFVERGFLQEINRRLLHPCGLALEVVYEEWGEMHLGGVWDARDDPEGIIFAESEPPDWRKRNRVNEEWNVHVEGRGPRGLKLQDPYVVSGAGVGVQPCPEPGEDVDSEYEAAKADQSIE